MTDVKVVKVWGKTAAELHSTFRGQPSDPLQTDEGGLTLTQDRQEERVPEREPGHMDQGALEEGLRVTTQQLAKFSVETLKAQPDCRIWMIPHLWGRFEKIVYLYADSIERHLRYSLSVRPVFF